MLDVLAGDSYEPVCLGTRVGFSDSGPPGLQGLVETRHSLRNETEVRLRILRVAEKNSQVWRQQFFARLQQLGQVEHRESSRKTLQSYSDQKTLDLTLKSGETALVLVVGPSKPFLHQQRRGQILRYPSQVVSDNHCCAMYSGKLYSDYAFHTF